jgi:diguanylate cyclase
MRYTETPGQSAELLRLVLPRIARHGGHYAPTSYSVWYEHLSGINPGLSEALEAGLHAHETLGQSAIDELYATHIQGRDNRTVEQLQAGLSELLRKLAQIATNSGAGAQEYASALAECEQELVKVSDTEGLQRVIQSLVTSTAAARSTTETLRAEVEASRGEVQKLRTQLGTLASEAQNDPLTGLRNRRGFERAVAALYGERPEALSGAALLVADIDNFKRVNDTYGHLFGDQVLRAAAQVLQSVIKGRDIVARFGGEEFIILLPDTPGQGAVALAEQVRAAFSSVRIRRNGSDEYIDKVTISVGVAVPAPSETLERAIERADRAMYQAKEDGRNCVRIAGFGEAAGLQAKAASPATRVASAAR